MTDSPGRPILVVDDDPLNLRMVCDFLSSLGLPVAAAADAGTALAEMTARTPALLVLDVTMPGVSGLDLLGMLRRVSDTRLARVPVLVVTANAR